MMYWPLTLCECARYNTSYELDGLSAQRSARCDDVQKKRGERLRCSRAGKSVE